MKVQMDVVKNLDSAGKPYYVGMIRNTLPEPNPCGLFTKWREVARGYDKAHVTRLTQENISPWGCDNCGWRGMRFQLIARYDDELKCPDCEAYDVDQVIVEEPEQS